MTPPKKPKRAFAELSYVEKLRLLQQYGLITPKRGYRFWSYSGVYYEGQLPPPPKLEGYLPLSLAFFSTLEVLAGTALCFRKDPDLGNILAPTFIVLIQAVFMWGIFYTKVLEYLEARRSPNP